MDIEEEGLAAFLEKGKERLKQNVDRDLYRPDRVRDGATHVCPFQGFVAPGRPGCLLHPSLYGEDQRTRSLYGSKICEDYFCPAHRLLTEEEKTFLIEGINHWYPYTIAVIDPWFFSKWYRLLRLREMEQRKPLMETVLRIHGKFLARHPGPVFFFTEQERLTIEPAEEEESELMEAAGLE
jgi:hypothetical protein